MPYVPSDEQRAVIETAAPVVVVLGGAGAGRQLPLLLRRPVAWPTTMPTERR